MLEAILDNRQHRPRPSSGLSSSHASKPQWSPDSPAAGTPAVWQLAEGAIAERVPV